MAKRTRPRGGRRLRPVVQQGFDSFSRCDLDSKKGSWSRKIARLFQAASTPGERRTTMLYFRRDKSLVFPPLSYAGAAPNGDKESKERLKQAERDVQRRTQRLADSGSLGFRSRKVAPDKRRISGPPDKAIPSHALDFRTTKHL